MSIFLMCQDSGHVRHVEEDSYSKRFKRDLKSDIKLAVDLAFELKEKLNELHPGALECFMKLINSHH